MNELIQAAKAVIADWERHQNAHFASINTLCAAVGRAESAQQTERERIKQIIIYQFGDLVSDLDDVFAMIDEDSEHLPMRSEHLPAGDQVNPENPVHPVQT